MANNNVKSIIHREKQKVDKDMILDLNIEPQLDFNMGIIIVGDSLETSGNNTRD